MNEAHREDVAHENIASSERSVDALRSIARGASVVRTNPCTSSNPWLLSFHPDEVNHVPEIEQDTCSHVGQHESALDTAASAAHGESPLLSPYLFPPLQKSLL